MNRSKSAQSKIELTPQQLKQLRKNQALIAKELPDLAVKHERLCNAAQERTHSVSLRRAIHASRILLDDLAVRAGTNLNMLDAFLTGDSTLTSDIIDRLTIILQLKLEPAHSKSKPRRARAA